jgi:nitroimidazol reductase NimA-like FMN-containing flavoprotein (pyridoxamine 5'-phosphate oxidase superfamily)
MRLTGPYSRAEAAAFLDETAVPLRLACHGAGGLWIVALWFRYVEDRGVFECATGRSADVVGMLESDPSVAFEVSTNDPPYRGVRGNGTVELTEDEGKERLRDLLERYLGGTDSDLAAELLEADREEVRIVIEPERLHSWDFSERM